ncbi:tape measure protein [Aeromicrobium sp. HA]|uniref:tape measure protein n=1 Tax=Aeromicrobium sp. HA TaxID=3009077 RepID=UPI0022AE941C|nr:tape measure protein [Aeromicrobium sp. HA]
MAATLGKSLKIGAVGAAAGAGALVGAALWKGMGRLKAIDEARGKLTGLGHSARSVNKIMDNALASVKGTAFGLDEASSVAASAVAAGIKPGKDLTRNLKLVADAATIAGTDMGSMGAIFNKVAASNKVQMDVINQLHDAGVPALSLLAKQMGVTAEEASEMASKGKVDFATFQKAMDKGLGGAALESGKTMSGAFKNMQAALGRLGASVLAGVFPKIAPLLTKITGWLDQAGPYAERFGKVLGDVFSRVGNALGGLFSLMAKGDFTSQFRESFGVAEDSKLVEYLLNIRRGAQLAFTWLSANLPKAWAAVKAFFASFASSSEGGKAAALFAELKLTMQAWWTYAQAMFNAARITLAAFWKMFGPTVLAYVRPAFSNLITIVRGALQIVRGIFQTVAALLKGDWKGAWSGIKTIASGAMKVIVGVVRQAGNVLRTVMSVLGIALKAAATAAWAGVKAAFVAGVRASVDAVLGIRGKVVSAMAGAATWLFGAGKAIIQGLINGIASMIGSLVSKLASVTKLIPKNKGPISTDRILLVKNGQAVMDGFIRGVVSREPAVRSTLGAITAGIPSSSAGSPAGRLGDPLSASPTGPSVLNRRQRIADIREAIDGIGVILKDENGRPLRRAILGA